MDKLFVGFINGRMVEDQQDYRNVFDKWNANKHLKRDSNWSEKTQGAGANFNGTLLAPNKK